MFEVSLNTDTVFGKYTFCGNTQSRFGSGYTMTNRETSSVYGNTKSYYFQLLIKMNKYLYDSVEIIQMYDYKGFLIGYTTSKFNKTISFIRKITPEHLGTEIKVDFCKYKILSQEEKTILEKTLRRRPTEVIYNKTFIIEDISNRKETSCILCFNDINDVTKNDKRTLPCGDIVHEDCLKNYLVESKIINLNNVHERCLKEHCCGGEKPSNFECPFVEHIL